MSYYLVSDILSPSFPSDQLRMLIFTNAFALSDALRSAVSRLQGGERTLVWWYAPGILALENSTADAARISALVGIAGITRGAGAASLSTRWSENCSYGNATIEGLPPWHADPWFYLDEHAASAAASVEVLGRYVDGGAASLVRQSFAEPHGRVLGRAWYADGGHARAGQDRGRAAVRGRGRRRCRWPRELLDGARRCHSPRRADGATATLGGVSGDAQSADLRSCLRALRAAMHVVSDAATRARGESPVLLYLTYEPPGRVLGGWYAGASGCL